MVQCELQGRCTKHEWYHLECINIESLDDLPEKWFCSPPCEKRGSDEAENDGVLQCYVWLYAA